MKPEECTCRHLAKVKQAEEGRGHQVLSTTEPEGYDYVCKHPAKKKRAKRPCLPLSHLPCPISLSLDSFPE